jgi:tetratricopeptide (TPR) repeat protein
MALSARDEGAVPDATGVLASWKTIGDYFHCNERTVKRWEKTRRLPVHRAPGGGRGLVFAYTEELERWLRAAEGKQSAEASGMSREPNSRQNSALSVAANLSGNAAARALAPIAGRAELHRHAVSRRWLIGGAGGALLLLMASVTLWLPGGSHAVSPLASDVVRASPVTPRHVPAPEAEELYLRGSYFWNLRTADGLAKAMDFYTQAIVKDPSYAEAYVGLAETYDLLPQFGQGNLRDSLGKAEAAADRAIALDPKLADAHAAKAFALFFRDWDISGSDAEFRRALALDPDSALTHQWYASTLSNRLEGAECLKQIDEALRLNPTSAAVAADAALFQAAFGDFDAGMKALKELEETQPTLATPAYFLRELDFARGDYPAYIADARRYASITRRPDDIVTAQAAARGWAQGGRIGLLQARMRVLKAAFDRGTEDGFWLGQTLLLLGYPHQALPYFRASVDQRFILLISMADCPWARPLASDPGYAALFDLIRARSHGTPDHPAVVPMNLRLPE